MGGNEWIADPTQAEDQAIPYEILPFDEMDGLVNPERGLDLEREPGPDRPDLRQRPAQRAAPGGGIRYITPAFQMEPKRPDN